MGARAAHRYFLTAERFDAAEALRIGFVHEVVAADALDAKVAEIAQPWSTPARSRCVQKTGAGRGRAQPITPRSCPTVEGIADVRVSPEGREGVQAFLQKRKPNWLA
jgi:methylglutaconyl-CoA hydratase